MSLTLYLESLRAEYGAQWGSAYSNLIYIISGLRERERESE